MARTIDEAEALIKKYEQDGVAKLYYALRRKAWEMADMLNSVNLKSIEIEDGKNKSFERIRFMINDSSAVATAVKSLEGIIDVSGNEEKDVSGRRLITTPESISNVL